MDELVEIYRTPHERSCRDRALVLRSQGIPYLYEARDGFHVLLVELWIAARAADQLRRYEEENRGFRLQDVLPPPAPFAAGGTLAFALVLLVFGLLQSIDALGFDWTAAGAAEAGAARLREPWRAVTALTLHADLGHLLSNVIFGAFFGFLVAHVHGGGLGYLAVLVSGVLGNWTNAWLQGPAHSSIGASTAVLGAAGILCGSEARRRHLLRQPRARRVAPIGVALVFLLYLGVGEKTDVLAHVTGCLWGLALGAALPSLLARGALKASVQLACGAAALLLLGLCWLTALAA